MYRLFELETERFTLRKIEAGDLETLHSYWSDDRETKYMNVSFKSFEETKQMVELLNSLPETGEGRRWAIAGLKPAYLRSLFLKNSTFSAVSDRPRVFPKPGN